MAEIVEQEKESKPDSSAVEEALASEGQGEQQQAEEPVSKYADKSREELERMIDNNQEMIGRQSDEVRAARAEIEAVKAADRVLERATQSQAKQKPEEKLDYFGDPEKAIKSTIQSAPELQAVKQEVETLRLENIKRELSAAHPDFKDVLSSNDFGNWVAASSLRTKSFQAMNAEFDVEIAKELISSYKAAAQQQQPQSTTADRKESVLAASSGNVSGSSEKTTGKKLRASDLRELMTSNPSRYEELYPEILKAYQEGRVINN